MIASENDAHVVSAKWTLDFNTLISLIDCEHTASTKRVTTSGRNFVLLRISEAYGAGCIVSFPSDFLALMWLIDRHIRHCDLTEIKLLDIVPVVDDDESDRSDHKKDGGNDLVAYSFHYCFY